MMDTHITLQAILGGNTSFQVPLDVIELSMTVKRLIEDMQITKENAANFPIPVQISAEHLEKIIEWCTHHKDGSDNLEGPISPRGVEDDLVIEWVENHGIPEWDQQFFKKMEPDFLLQLLKDANYLHVKGLVELTSKCIAEMINGKTTEQLATDFGIIDDQTEEGRLAIDQEVDWLTNEMFNANNA